MSNSLAHKCKATFTWNETKVEAAKLVAADELTESQLASKLGVSKRTLAYWKVHPEFAAQVKAILSEAVQTLDICQKTCRLTAMNERWRKLHALMAARAAAAKKRKHPAAGQETGLLVRGRLDASLLKAMTDLEKAGALELGQLITKVAPVTPDGKRELRHWTPPRRPRSGRTRLHPL